MGEQVNMEKVYDVLTKRVFTIHEPFESWRNNFEIGRYIKVPPNGKLPLNVTYTSSNKCKHY